MARVMAHGTPFVYIVVFLAIDANITLMLITQGKESKIVFKQISSAGKLLVLKSFCIQGHLNNIRPLTPPASSFPHIITSSDKHDIVYCVYLDKDNFA